VLTIVFGRVAFYIIQLCILLVPNSVDIKWTKKDADRVRGDAMHDPGQSTLHWIKSTLFDHRQVQEDNVPLATDEQSFRSVDMQAPAH
jgi:hypothetical protein